MHCFSSVDNMNVCIYILEMATLYMVQPILNHIHGDLMLHCQMVENKISVSRTSICTDLKSSRIPDTQAPSCAIVLRANGFLLALHFTAIFRHAHTCMQTRTWHQYGWLRPTITPPLHHKYASFNHECHFQSSWDSCQLKFHSLFIPHPYHCLPPHCLKFGWYYMTNQELDFIFILL